MASILKTKHKLTTLLLALAALVAGALGKVRVEVGAWGGEFF
jgi:hypothetical protein